MTVDETTEGGAPVRLPELTDERIAVMEESVFARIAADARNADRAASELLPADLDSARSRRRRRGWWTAGAAAAVVVVAIAIAPAVGGLVGMTASNESGASSAVGPMEPAQPAPDQAFGSEADAARDAAGAVSPAESGDEAREVIATASATVRVHDVPAAVDAVGDAADAAGGYVESTNVGATGVASDTAIDGTYVPVPADGGWITVRVPADRLTGVLDGLSAVGEVESSSMSRQDVTLQAVDLRARIDAAQASVDRLTQLLAQAATTADLIAAESALAERQATLESYQQQLTVLDDQVAMSSLTVTVAPRVVEVSADPAGFGDGLLAGWNGVIATLNGVVIALGFLLPWLAIAAVVAAVVWGVRRIVKRRRSAAAAGSDS